MEGWKVEHAPFCITETRFWAKRGKKSSGPTRPRTPALGSSALRASPRASRAPALRADLTLRARTGALRRTGPDQDHGLVRAVGLNKTDDYSPLPPLGLDATVSRLR